MQSQVFKRGNGTMKIVNLKDQKGFALIAALLAILILTAVGVLVITVSTQDIRVSTRVTGEKKAFAAAEAGIHRLTQNLNPDNLAASEAIDIQVDAANDPDTRYTINTPTAPTSGPAVISLPGYAIGGGQEWGQTRYDASVTGTNTRYQSSVRIDVGVGFGPVEITTMYR